MTQEKFFINHQIYAFYSYVLQVPFSSKEEKGRKVRLKDKARSWQCALEESTCISIVYFYASSDQTGGA
jgi:hypothetical protein